jgi:hypothetical protein
VGVLLGSVFSNAPPEGSAAYAKKGAGSTWLFVSHEQVTYEQVLAAVDLDTCVHHHPNPKTASTLGAKVAVPVWEAAAAGLEPAGLGSQF